MWVPPVPALAARNSCLNRAPTRPTRGCGQRATRRTLTGPRCELGLHPRIQREAAQAFRHRGYVADPFVDVHLHVTHSLLFCAQSDFPEDRHATGESCVTLDLSRRRLCHVKASVQVRSVWCATRIDVKHTHAQPIFSYAPNEHSQTVLALRHASTLLYTNRGSLL